MQGTFDKLQQLQEILSKKYEIERELKEIPRSIETKTELLNRLKTSYIEKNEQLNTSRENLTVMKREQGETERNREDSEKKMDLIKTQREYEALDKEIRDFSENEQKIRRDIQKEERAVEEMVSGLEKEEQLIQMETEDLEEETRKIEEESKERVEVLKKLQGEEDKITPGMDENILFKFERIIKNKSGLGIVPARKGTCSGCNMILPAQFVNDVRKGEGILFCPYCSRILYFEDVVEEGDMYVDDIGGLAGVIDNDSLGGLADLVSDDLED